MASVIRRAYVRRVANQLRRAARIKAPPVDLRLIVAACGLRYEEVDYFPDEVDALIVCSDAGNVAVVNGRQAEARRRFSLAHEIGHYVLHRDGTDFQEPPMIDFPPVEEDDRAGGSPTEFEANIFAGELLVPVEYLKKYFRPGMTSADSPQSLPSVRVWPRSRFQRHMRALFKL